MFVYKKPLLVTEFDDHLLHYTLLPLQTAAMSLQVQNANNVKIYTVSGSKGSRSIPDWLARRNKKALKNDLGNRPVSLHALGQDFLADRLLTKSFRSPVASNRMETPY
jgi:poly-gamma-glutamate capsule biosynthesis protein CapA/YwtB (metallophosphatase superfamily)